MINEIAALFRKYLSDASESVVASFYVIFRDEMIRRGLLASESQISQHSFRIMEDEIKRLSHNEANFNVKYSELKSDFARELALQYDKGLRQGFLESREVALDAIKNVFGEKNESEM